MTTAQAATVPSNVSSGQPGFGSTLLSEWTKVRSVRSTYIMLGLAVVLSIGMTALISLIIAGTWEEWPPQEQAAFEPTVFSFFGSLFGAILISVWGVTLITNEYSSGMIRVTLTATPKRGRVLLAKVLVITGVTLVVGTISTFGMFLAGQAVFGASGMASASLSEADALRAVALVSLISPAYPIVGAALAVFMRSTAGAITSILALIFAPSIFGGLLPPWWQENVLAFVLGPVTDSITIQHLGPPSLMYLDTWVAVGALAAWLIVFVGGAYYVLERRDA
ncbi:MAG: ABC transporter permease subunit [Dehalococcoidia bacterium]